MTKYTELKGHTIKELSADPSAPLLGEIWFNSTDGVLKAYKDVPLSWSTGGNVNTARDRYATAGNGTLTSALIFGGAPSFTVNTELYNGSSWTELNDLVTARGENMRGSGTSTAALAFGGYGGPFFGAGATNNTESWNGSNWTEVNDLNTSKYQHQGNGTRTSALAYGGTPAAGVAFTQTESWNGTSWTEVNDLNIATRQMASAGANNTSALCFGGGGGSPVPYTAKTESWNGTNWTEVSDLNADRITLGGMGTQTAALAFGGFRYVGGVYYRADPGITESWNGSSWTEVADLNTARHALDGVGSNTSGIAASGNPTSSAQSEEWAGGAGTVEFGDA
jgi:hypothetical protein